MPAAGPAPGLVARKRTRGVIRADRSALFPRTPAQVTIIRRSEGENRLLLALPTPRASCYGTSYNAIHFPRAARQRALPGQATDARPRALRASQPRRRGPLAAALRIAYIWRRIEREASRASVHRAQSDIRPKGQHPASQDQDGPRSNSPCLICGTAPPCTETPPLTQSGERNRRGCVENA
jgi:hypothetical protein